MPLPILRVVRVGTHRAPELDVEHQAEASRHDADDGVGVAVDRHDPADHIRRAAEAPLPVAVADRRDVRCTLQALVGGELAAEHRADAKRSEQVRCHDDAVDALRLSDARDRVAAGVPDKRIERLEGRAHVSVVPVVLSRDHRDEIPVYGRAPQHQPLGLGERHGIEQGRVDDTEHGHIGADADSEDEDDHGAEAGRPAQRPAGVADILPDAFHQYASVRVGARGELSETWQASCPTPSAPTCPVTV